MTVELLPQKYRLAPIDDLRPHPQNPRRGDVDDIHDSMEQNGAYGVVMVQKSTGYIIAGKHRIDAARRGGLKKYPIVEIDVDDDRALRILLRDNASSDRATYDDEIRADVLQQLLDTDLGLVGSGYDDDETEEIMRAAGRYADDATDFLNDALNAAPEDDDEGDQGPARNDDGDEVPGFYTLKYTVDDAQRATIRNAIVRAKQMQAGMTSPEALAWLCDQWMGEE